MEIASFVVALLSLIVNTIMLCKVEKIYKNITRIDGRNNKNANQVVKGTHNQSSIQQ